jgi:hypothetical protein
MLDYEYDPDFGTPHCDAIYAWTENEVLFVFDYDGSTQIHDPAQPNAGRGSSR